MTPRSPLLLPSSQRCFASVLSFALWLFLVPKHTLGRDVPMKKAVPPLMDPIPTLPEITHRIYLDVAIGDANNEKKKKTKKEEEEEEVVDGSDPRMGRIVIGVFGHNAPTAAENFRLLASCTFRHETNALCYKDTIFHRIVPFFAIQGGDTTHANGIGGMAAIGRTAWKSNHNQNTNNNNNNGSYQPYMINATNFNRPYMVAVATPNSQRAKSQFFITTVKAQWLEPYHYTIFGTVLEGRDFLHTMEQMAGTYGGRPLMAVRIVDCGELPLQPYDKEPHY